MTGRYVRGSYVTFWPVNSVSALTQSGALNGKPNFDNPQVLIALLPQ
jgi:hypothetical protein